MKKIIFMFGLLIAGFLILSTQALAQEKAPVKVKGSEVVTGVVIVHVQRGEKVLDLQCNQGAGSCKALASGSYLMLELPENHGMYDCKNVEIYRGDPDKPEAAELMGAYCLVEK